MHSTQATVKNGTEKSRSIYKESMPLRVVQGKIFKSYLNIAVKMLKLLVI